MEVILAVITLALAFGVMAAVSRRAGTRPTPTPPGHRSPPAPPEEPILDPADVADLEVRFGAVDLEHSWHRDGLLHAHLQPLVERGVPLRVIEPVPGLRGARLRFADGTAVVVRGDAPGDVGVLAALIRARSVPIGRCSTDASGTHLVFAWTERRRDLSLLVTGLDQPD